MKLLPGNIYHIYNRGNNKQQIFFEKRNYAYFTEKIKTHVASHCDLIAYCLMPNHFHLMVNIPLDNPDNKLNKEIGTMLRSYTRAINLQQEFTGSLFQQKTQAKNVTEHRGICFNYIHQNPLKAGIADKLEDWEYSSFNEYTEKSGNRIVNIELGKKLIEFNSIKEFYELSYQFIEPEKREKIFM